VVDTSQLVVQPGPKPESPKHEEERIRPKDPSRAITYEYLGYLGPFGRPFAVFRHDGEIELALTGQTLDGGVVLRTFDHLEAVFTALDDEDPLKISLPVAER